MATSFDMANMLGTQMTTPGGRTFTATNPGKKAPSGTGAKHVPGMSSSQVAAAVVPEATPPPIKRPQPGAPGGPPHPNVPTKRPFSVNNPMVGVQAPPVPHPGSAPPYPDARSQQPTMLPNGMMMMPMPKGFPVGTSGTLHVPRSMAQMMGGLVKQGPY